LPQDKNYFDAWATEDKMMYVLNGREHLINGFNTGMLTMCPGSVRRVEVPATDGFREEKV